MGKLDWSGVCATSTSRHQCSEKNCILFSICLIKDASRLTNKENNNQERGTTITGRVSSESSLVGTPRPLDTLNNEQPKIKCKKCNKEMEWNQAHTCLSEETK